jgi:CDP-diacylglycerol--glycerol-3-phosphate 3-phosphatidyltransferase
MAPEAEVDDSANTTQVLVNDQLGPKAPPPGFLRKSFPNFPWHSLPNLLTYIRCLAIPGLVALFYLPEYHVATALVFGFASFTDWLDGYFARRWDITSPFGAFLDPVADKLMVATALILLSGRHGAEVAVPTSIILSRELAVSALREWMAQRGQRDSVKVGMQGKVKTAATMVALCVLLLVPYQAKHATWLSKLYQPGLAMLYLCTVVTVTSGSAYFRAAAPALLGKKD